MEKFIIFKKDSTKTLFLAVYGHVLPGHFES